MLNGFDCLVLGSIILVLVFAFAYTSVRWNDQEDIWSYLNRIWFHIGDHGIMILAIFAGAALTLYGAFAVPTGH